MSNTLCIQSSKNLQRHLSFHLLLGFLRREVLLFSWLKIYFLLSSLQKRDWICWHNCMIRKYWDFERNPKYLIIGKKLTGVSSAEDVCDSYGETCDTLECVSTQEWLLRLLCTWVGFICAIWGCSAGADLSLAVCKVALPPHGCWFKTSLDRGQNSPSLLWLQRRHILCFSA